MKFKKNSVLRPENFVFAVEETTELRTLRLGVYSPKSPGSFVRIIDVRRDK